MRIATDRRGRRATTGTVAALMLAVVLAGCSGSSSPSSAPRANSNPSDAKVLLASARTTASEGSARMAMSMHMGDAGASEVAISAQGVSDFATGDSQLTMTFGGAMSAFMAGDIEVRSVDKVMYMKLPSLGSGPLAAVTGGKEWLSIDASKFAAGSSPSSGFGLGQTDPTQFLAYLETVSDDVKAVGTEKVRGADTTHYHATMDLGKAVEGADVPPELRASLRKLLASIGKGAPTIPSDVYVDDAGRVRRLAMKIDLASFVGDAAGSGALGVDAVMTMSIDLYDFGVKVDVKAPPAADVAPLPSFGMGGFGAFGTNKRTSDGATSTQ